MRAQGRRWLRLVHKLIRPAADTVERMQKGAYKVDSKKKSQLPAMRQTSRSAIVKERLRYPMQVKGQSSYREPIHLSTASRRTSRLGLKAFI